MDNAPTEVSFEAHSVMVKERAGHPPKIIFTKESIDADKLIIVVNLPTVRFICFPTRQEMTGIIHGACDPYR